MKNKKTIMNMPRVFFVALLLLVSSAVSAQINQIRGAVSDDMGPLIGVTVCELMPMVVSSRAPLQTLTVTSR